MGVLLMKIYARIEKNQVAEIFQTDKDITTLFHPSIVWVDVTNISGVATGWHAKKGASGWRFSLKPQGMLTDFYTTVDGIKWKLDINAAKKRLLEIIQAEKKRIRDGGIEIDGVIFDSDKTASIAYRLFFATKLSQDPTYIKRWKASNGTWVTMDAKLFAKIETSMENLYSSVFEWQEAKTEEIEACTTADELEQIEVKYQ